MDSTLHITIGTAAGKGLSLQDDLRLLKAGLLYGDRVKLCSLMSSMLVLFSQLTNLSEDQRLDALEQWSSILSDPSAAANISILKQLKRKRYRSKEELLVVMRASEFIRRTWAELQSKIDDIATEAGADGLVAALESGLVELEVYNQEDTEEMLRAFFDSVGDAVVCGGTYPLFDDQTGDLVRAALREGKLSGDRIGMAKGRIVGLASDLFERLPLFDKASVDEILAIRAELERSLVRFRSAIIEYSRLIESAQWDRSFKQEAEIVFREKVEPAVAEVEDAVKANRLIRDLLRKFATGSLLPATSSGLGLLVSNVAAFSPLAGTSLGFAAGVGTLAYSTVEEWQERHRDIERNQLYFYYRAGQELRTRAGAAAADRTA